MNLNEAVTESMGNARRKGNESVLYDQTTLMERLLKIMKKTTFSHIDSKAKDQAKAVARIKKALAEIDDAVYDLQIIDKRNK